jgi:hypothetical protein
MHYMHAIRYFWVGQQLCSRGQFEEGAALFIGGLEGPTGTNGNGFMPYTLADKRCISFKTCGSIGTELTGVGYVNIQIINLFNQFKTLSNTTNCTATAPTLLPIVTRITQLMKVPVVQGTLLYSEKISSATGEVPYAVRAEAAVFAAAVLPYVHKCNKASAAIIYKEISTGKGAKVFTKIKKAFEKNYKCMGILCSDVGGIIDPVTNTYKKNTKPCIDCKSKGGSCNAGSECCSKQCQAKKCK